MMKGAKRKVGSEEGREVAIAETQCDDVMMAESQEEIAEEKEAKGQEEDEEDEEGKKPDDSLTTKEKPEYLDEKRNFQNLWKAAFLVGTEWEYIDALYEHNWDFKHLEEALEEGGMLYGKKVFVFVNTEPQSLLYKGVNKVALVPIVVAIESPFPPSDKIGVTSVQRGEEIVPMKQMKMDWVPYIPFDKRDRQVDRMNSQIFTLGCTQRRSALRHLKEDRVMEFQYCVPYFYDPFKEDEFEKSTVVHIFFPSEPPVGCKFDWMDDRLEVFTDELIEDEELLAEQKDDFKEFVIERVRAARKARQEARDARMKAIEKMSEDDKQAFQSIKFYKFYPSDFTTRLKSYQVAEN